MKIVLILNGVATSGKDTFVKLFKGVVDKYRVYNYSSIIKVKQIAEIMGWMGEKEDKHRKFLSDLKDLWSMYNNGPFNDLVKYLNNIEVNPYGSDYIFIHIREPIEIDKFKKYCEGVGVKCCTIIIIRPGLEVPNNHADMNVHKYKYDYTFFNDGTLEEFKNKAEFLVKDLKGEEK